MGRDSSDTSWRKKAACLGRTDLFFPSHVCWVDCPDDCQAGRAEAGRYERIRKAREVCNSCHVEAECLEWALEVRFPIGFIGGRSERERKLLIKSRAMTGSPA